MAASSREPGVTPTVAALLSGSVMAAFTVAATQISLRADATRAELYHVLNWAMYVTAAATVITLLWVVAGAIRSQALRLERLRDLEAHLPLLIRMVRRTDKHWFRADGSGRHRFECEIESGSDATVPWFTFPVFAGSLVGGTPWEGCNVTRVLVDGEDCDPVRLFVPRHRKLSYAATTKEFTDVAVDEAGVRIPSFLSPAKRRCVFVIEFTSTASMPDLATEESCIVDISHVTDEVNVYISGEDGYEIRFSSAASAPVRASQLSGDIEDQRESAVQSEGCWPRKLGVHWRSTSAKVGYRYEIWISGRTVA